MIRCGPLWLAVLAALPAVARAAEIPLNEREREGRRLFVQSCGICHMKPTLTSKRYGPALYSETVTGKEEGIHALILGGSQRMPGFQYTLTPQQIDTIIQYLKRVPAPAEARPSASQQNPVD